MIITKEIIVNDSWIFNKNGEWTHSIDQFCNEMDKNCGNYTRKLLKINNRSDFCKFVIAVDWVVRYY